MGNNKRKIALISVYNKKGIEKFARDLIDLGWEILASRDMGMQFDS